MSSSIPSILIVEDNLSLNQMYVKTLKRFSPHTFGVGSVQEGLSYLRDINPNPALLLLDLELGDGKGTDLIPHLAYRPVTQIIVASGNADRPEYAPLLAQADRVLLKPVTPRDLSAVVEQMMDKL
jgi:DNA-binding response OmpR family regulator